VPIQVGGETTHVSQPERVWGHRFELEMDGVGWLEADLCSEGTLLVLGILTAVHALGPGKLILLDDIDRALHPEAQADLIKGLRRLLELHPTLQILGTSHSPYLLDHFAPEEVRVMRLADDGFAVCKKLTDHPEWEKWDGVMRPGEFWGSNGEDWVAS
jgi:predicted ATPase